MNGVICFLRVHACCRLVEQDEFGFGGEGAGNFNFALLPVGQIFGDAVACAQRQTDKTQQSPRFKARILFRFTKGSCAEDGAQGGTLWQSAMCADKDIFDYAHVGKESNILKGAAHAQSCNLVGPTTGNVETIETEGAFIGLIDACNDVE